MFAPGSTEEALHILETTISTLRMRFEIKLTTRHFLTKYPQRIRQFHLSYEACKGDPSFEEVRRKHYMRSFYYNTIINMAVMMNDLESAEKFIKIGAPTNNPDRKMRTPLEIAIMRENFDMCAMLLLHNSTRMHSRFSSHLIYSMFATSNKEIQWLLFNYEPDVNISFLGASLLCIAIKKCQFLIPQLLERGADVNQNDTLGFILKNPISVEYFKLIWDRIDYEDWQGQHFDTILFLLFANVELHRDLWKGYMRTIIEDSRIGYILFLDDNFVIAKLVEGFVRRGFDESHFYDLICVLLTVDCYVSFLDVHKVYDLLGRNSDTYKILAHIQITDHSKNADVSFSRVHFCFHKPVSEILENLFFSMRAFRMHTSFKDIARFFTVSEDIRPYLIKKFPPYLLHITLNKCKGAVPSLLELARNSSRDFIIERYQIKHSSQYQSIVKHMILPKKLKGILLFEIPMYYDV